MHMNLISIYLTDAYMIKIQLIFVEEMVLR